MKNLDSFMSNFIDEKQFLHHTKYYHYTTIENADKILNSTSIKMSKLWNRDNANDYKEQEWYSKNGRNLFSFCLSTGTSESLPLWYLYSGIGGDGIRIEFKKSAIKHIVENSKVYIEENGKKHLLQKDCYKIFAYDILYIGKDSTQNAYRIKHNTDVFNGISVDKYREIKNTYNKSPKGLIWFYEKETRLEIKILDKEILKKREYEIFLDISDVLDKVTLRLGPQATDERRNEIIESQEYTALKKFIYEKMELSNYVGDINIKIKNKLCDECIKKG